MCIECEKSEYKSEHRAEFVVVNEAANSILGEQLVQKMGQVEVRYDRIHVIDDRKPLQQESLMSHEAQSRPWSKVLSDLFEIKDHHYFVLVDYYSSFVEVERLTTTNTTADIRAMKKHLPHMKYQTL